MNNEIMFQPSASEIKCSNMQQFLEHINSSSHSFKTYDELYAWSISNSSDFWEICADYFKIKWHQTPTSIITPSDHPPFAKWFTGATLNYSEHCLAGPDDATVLIAIKEGKENTKLTRAQLKQAVQSLTLWLLEHDIKPGDVVAGILPNGPEAVIAHLAASAMGAIWTSCAVEFGAPAIIERLIQVKPKIIIFTSHYQYSGKIYQQLDKISTILPKLPTIEHMLCIDKIDKIHGRQPYIFSACLNHNISEFQYASLPFDHPLTIVFSSGTTGMPKCIVHGAGNVLLQHMKEHQLHTNLGHGKKLLYFTTCGWMMWNWQLSALASGVTIVTYDGSPLYPTPQVLFDVVNQQKVQVLGISARYLVELQKRDIRPIDTHQLKPLETILSTGSPLSPASYDYVYKHIKSDIRLESISGGTDILSCFALGNPLLPVMKGQLTSIGLGMAVDVVDDNGKTLVNQKGLLVCRKPALSMPIYFHNDPGSLKYYQAYYDQLPKIWVHGDYAQMTFEKTLIIYGRSDATLNPSGVRIGTAEIYNQLQELPYIHEAVAVDPIIAQQECFILFVTIMPGEQLTPKRIDEIKNLLKRNCSPRHVPDVILQAQEFPMTASGKIMEKTIKQCCQQDQISNLNAVSNQHTLKYFESIHTHVEVIKQ